METQAVKMIDGGKLVVPAAMRRALGLKTGDTVIVGIEDGELRVRSYQRSLEMAQALVRKYIPANVSLVDELIADRRAEAERE